MKQDTTRKHNNNKKKMHAVKYRYMQNLSANNICKISWVLDLISISS